MTALEIFYIYAPLYLVRNVLTFINFIRKKKNGELDEVVEITIEDAMEHGKKTDAKAILNWFEMAWGVVGWFTPLGWIFICLSINNLIRIIISYKAPIEKASNLFALNSIIQILITGYLVWNIYGGLL